MMPFSPAGFDVWRGRGRVAIAAVVQGCGEPGADRVVVVGLGEGGQGGPGQQLRVGG